MIFFYSEQLEIQEPEYKKVYVIEEDLWNQLSSNEQGEIGFRFNSVQLFKKGKVEWMLRNIKNFH